MGYNYFELLNLSPDGPKANDKKTIQQAIDSWEIETRSAFNNAPNLTVKQELDAQLKELPGMRQMLTDPALCKRHAEEYKNKLLSQLDPVAKILYDCTPGKMKRISSVRIKRLAGQFRLMIPTVKKVFQAKGFEVIETTLTKVDFVLPEMMMGDLKKRFQDMHRFLNDHPENKYHSLVGANNLYEYLAIMKDGDIHAANTYQTSETDVVREEFEKLSKTHTGSDPFSLAASNIESTASTKIFSSKDSRDKYDHSLGLVHLQPLFDLLGQVPESIKLDQQFAEEIVKQIQKQFRDENQAIALYNLYGKLPYDNPYAPESTKVKIICANCGFSNAYDSLEEAHAQKCGSCQSPLFVTCPNPNCKKYVPSYANYCTCGQFMKAAMSFGLYCQQFRTALAKLNLEKAEEALARARSSKPDEIAELTKMENELKQTRIDIQKPIEELERLIISGSFNKAQEALNDLHAKRPNIDLQKQQESINKTRDEALLAFKRCEAETNEGKAIELCVNITAKYPDFVPPQDWLRRHPPYPVRSVRESQDAKNLSCTLQWEDDPRNRFVSYTIVRKENARPANSRDGTTVAKDLKTLIYTDSGLKPGKVYAYAIKTNIMTVSTAIAIARIFDFIVLNIIQILKIYQSPLI